MANSIKDRVTGPSTANVKRSDVPAPVAHVAPVVDVKKSSEPENLYGGAPHKSVTGPEGKAVSTTAATSALWREGFISSENAPLSVKTLKNLSMPQAQAKKAELEKKKADIETKIAGRAGELDQQWSAMRLTDRTAILKSYVSETKSLAADTRVNVDGALQKSESAQSQIESLHAQAQKLGPSRGANPGTPEERKALAAQIWAARHDHQTAVATATETIDKAGLKIERLAMTEAAIDPSKGANSKYGSMSGLVGVLFETNFQLSILNQLYFTPMQALTNELDREGKEAQKKKIIDDHWRQRDDLMRTTMKDVSLKEISGKRDLAKTMNADRVGDPTRMNATAVNKARS